MTCAEATRGRPPRARQGRHRHASHGRRARGVDEVIDGLGASSAHRRRRSVHPLRRRRRRERRPTAPSRDTDRPVRRHRRSLTHRGTSPRVLHCANSAGALGYPDVATLDGARRSRPLRLPPRAWLRGALHEKGEHLEPALTMRAQVSAVRRRLVAGRDRATVAAAARARRHGRHRAHRLRRRIPRAPPLRGGGARS